MKWLVTVRFLAQTVVNMSGVISVLYILKQDSFGTVEFWILFPIIIVSLGVVFVFDLEKLNKVTP